MAINDKGIDRLIARAKAHRMRRVARSVVVERLMGDALTYAKPYQRSNVAFSIPRNFTGVITIKIRIE